MSDDLARMERALERAVAAGDLPAVGEIASAMKAMLKEVNPRVDEPVSTAEAGAKMAAKDTGAGEAALIGAGRLTSQIGSGVKEAALKGVSRFLPGGVFAKAAQNELGAMGERQGAEDTAYGALQKKHPIATAAGETLPYAAVPTSWGIPAVAATVGALEAAKPGTVGERASRGLLGAGATAGGGLLAKGAASFIAPVTQKAAGKSHQGALEAAERIGYRPTLGESTGSRFIRGMEDYAARAPGGAGVMERFAADNATAVNRAAGRSFGATGVDEMTPQVFADAQKRLGQVFEDIKTLGGRPIQVGQNVGAAADEILRVQGKMLLTRQDTGIVELAKQARMWAQHNGRIDGETYQLLRSGLSESAFDATGTNKILYGKLLNALDDSADASLRASGNVALADSLRTVRPQYANLKTLEKGATAEAGNVSPARVASTLRTNNPGAFRRGQFVGTDIGDIAAVGEGLKPLRAGSPTFERGAVSNPISAALNAAWAYPLAKATTSPIATIYPRTIGKTAAARTVRQLGEPSGRAAVAAALQSGGLPLLPVMPE